MKKSIKEIIKDNIVFTGKFVEEYRKVYALVLGLIALFEVFFIVYWLINTKNYSAYSFLYLSAYILLLTSSLLSLFFLWLNKNNKISEKIMSLILHIYAVILQIWAVMISLLDLHYGNSIIVQMTISMVLSGLIILSPFFYAAICIASYAVIFIFNAINSYAFFSSSGSYLNLFIFILMCIIIAYRHYAVRSKETIQREYLKNLSYTDQLTGLGNETAYYKEIDRISKDIEDKKEIEFGVVLIDVNNVKATNDKYGHRFGCHLIVTGGMMLPDIFKNSKHYHIGGDEFVVILSKDDLANLDDIFTDFKNKLDYSYIEYEGKTLLLSLAYGCEIYQSGMTYKDVLQSADMKMYENKRLMKEKYNIVVR